MTDAQVETYSADDLEIFGLANAEYRFYQKDVIDALNDTLLMYDKLPDAMLGDIRDCFGHICDAVTRTDQPLEKRRSNINNAHNHLRRFILDCYKLQCIWFRQQLRAFDRKYRWSDLSDVHDGQFRPEYTRLKADAKDAFKMAQRVERPGNNDRAEEQERLEDDDGAEERKHLEDVYALYEKALKAYGDALEYVEKSMPAVERAAHKDTRRTVFSVLGWVIGIGLAVAGIVTNFMK